MNRELILRSSKGVAVLLFSGIMATLLHSESRRLYSWWWDSHNTPKNSKWLQDNLTDIDAKVKSMIKLIEEDADSFARRAEMYYKKRPELMKLVEEFYRAYRALAERYNHTTGELRHAHRTIARAFPDQVPSELIEGSSPSKFSEQEKEFHVLGLKCPVESLFDPSVSLEDGGKKGLKQLNEMSESEDMLRLKAENLILKDKVLDETERAEKAEISIQCLERALSDVEAEKETVFLEYQQCLEKLSKLEEELTNAENDSLMFNAEAIRAEIEVQTLREGLKEMEAEKNKELAKQREYLEKISYLDAMISQAEIYMKGLDAKGIEAESRSLALKAEISSLELEKEAVVHHYNQSLEKISNLENVVTVLEDEAKELKKQAEEAESEVSELKKALTELQKEKEASALKYKCCLETISKLETDLFIMKDENESLKTEVLIRTAQLKAVEEKLTLLELSNRSLQVEANNLSEKIASKDLKLSKKQDELEVVQTCLQDELSRHAQIEVTLKSLQQLHDQSQEDQKILAMELKDVLQMLTDMEGIKDALEQEIQQLRDENQSLNDVSLSSVASLEHMQDEIFNLREIKKRLEMEVSNHMSVSVSFQHEILRLKEEIQGLGETYRAFVEQMEAADLDPKCLETSISSLKNENSRLREKCEEGYNEKADLSQKLEKMEEDLKKKSVLENSLTELNNVLEESHEKVKSLEASCQLLQGEKGLLVNEKASLLCQLQAITENMRNLLEKNAVLESSLSSVKIELEGLKEKSKGLEEICGMLKHERSYLLTERDALVSKLENVEKKLETLEKKFLGLEERYADIEKEKESIYDQVEKLELSLVLEKQEQRSSQLLSERRLSGLENQICLLREQNKFKKREFEEELEKTIRAQFEISILQKFMKDLEEKNYTLIMECQKHVEASKLAEKVISELESESLEQQVEAELLLDEIEGLRLGIYQIFKCLETDSDFGPQGKVENEQIFFHHILRNIEDMKSSISKHEDENQQLVVENLVLLALLEQLRCKGMEVELQKIYLEQESKIMSEKFASICYEKEKLVQMNEQLKTDLSENHQYASTLKAELGRVCAQQDDLQKSYDEIKAAYSQVKRESADLLRLFSELREEKYMVDQHSDAILLESLKNANESVVLASFGVEKIGQLRSIHKDLNRQEEVNSNLVREMSTLREKLESQKEENLALKDAISSLETGMQEMRGYNDQMSQEILIGNMILVQAEENLKETEEKLITVEISNSTLCSTVDKLKTEIYESLKIRENLENKVNHLSEDNLVQTQEIESLQTANRKLESELDFLRDELQEHAIIEQTLHHELEEVNNEFELYEAEAESFYFDLQVSSIREVLFENKMHELTEVCQTLEDDNASKTSEIAEMKGKLCSMESEISRLKSQIDAYSPLMASLKDDISLLEHNVLLQAKIKAAHSQKSVILDIGTDIQTNVMQMPVEDRSLLTLEDLRMRVKAVSKLMEEMNKPPISRTRSNRKNGYESEIDQIEPIYYGTPKLRRLKSKNSESRNRVLMKDIPLDQVSNNSSLRRTRMESNVGLEDQMLELWEEAAEDRSTDKKIGESLQTSFRVREHDIIYDQFGHDTRNFEPPSTDSDIEKELGYKMNMSIVRRTIEPTTHQEVDDGKILTKLFSDAEKLETLQKMVRHLRRKLESSSNRKKSRNAKNGVDSETVLEQLAEAEDSIVQLVDFNCQLVKNIEECPMDDQMASPRVKQTMKLWRMKVDEHAQKGSERINRLQIELQKIQYVLLKMNDDEKKIKGKNMFLRNRTVVLRDFIYNGRKNSGKRKKGPFCGCFKESSNSRNGRGM